MHAEAILLPLISANLVPRRFVEAEQSIRVRLPYLPEQGPDNPGVSLVCRDKLERTGNRRP